MKLESVDGSENLHDAARAVRVEHVNGRVDYVFYATNNSVTYKLTDEIAGIEKELFFRGFVGVFSVDKKGSNIYRYINDGDIIGSLIGGKTEISGVVRGYTDRLSEKNEIRILPAQTLSAEEVSGLAGKYVFIDNGKNTRGGAYKIE